MPRNRVTMTNALGVEEYCIEEVTIHLVADFQGFTAMKQKWNLQILCFAFLAELKKFGNKMTELISHFFMANKVESC